MHCYSVVLAGTVAVTASGGEGLDNPSYWVQYCTYSGDNKKWLPQSKYNCLLIWLLFILTVILYKARTLLPSFWITRRQWVLSSASAIWEFWNLRYYEIKTRNIKTVQSGISRHLLAATGPWTPCSPASPTPRPPSPQPPRSQMSAPPCLCCCLAPCSSWQAASCKILHFHFYYSWQSLHFSTQRLYIWFYPNLILCSRSFHQKMLKPS